jgi:hypothetical protein
MLVPAFLVIFWSETFALSALLWWMPVMLIAGAGVFAESHVIRPLKESKRFADCYTFDTFLEYRLSTSEKPPPEY